MAEGNDANPWGPLTPEELAQQAADKSGLWLPGMDDRPRDHGDPPPPEFNHWGTTSSPKQPPITLEMLEQVAADMKALGPPPPKVVFTDAVKKLDGTTSILTARLEQNQIESAKAFLEKLHAEGKRATIVVDTDNIYIMAQPNLAKDFREMTQRAFDSAVKSMGVPERLILGDANYSSTAAQDRRFAAMVDRIAEPPRHWNCRCTMIPAVRWWNLPRHQRRLRWNRHARRRILIAEMTNALRDFHQADHGDAVDARTKP